MSKPISTPRTDAEFDLIKEMHLAQEHVEASCLYKRFIEGTPLENDVSCWISKFVMEKSDFARQLERELAELKLENTQLKHAINETSNIGIYAQSVTTDLERLKKELAIARQCFKDAMTALEQKGKEAKEWRECAEKLAKDYNVNIECSQLHHHKVDWIEAHHDPCPVVVRRKKAMDFYFKLKEASRE